jgi:hypothetical protein
VVPCVVLIQISDLEADLRALRTQRSSMAAETATATLTTNMLQLERDLSMANEHKERVEARCTHALQQLDKASTDLQKEKQKNQALEDQLAAASTTVQRHQHHQRVSSPTAAEKLLDHERLQKQVCRQSAPSPHTPTRSKHQLRMSERHPVGHVPSLVCLQSCSSFNFHACLRRLLSTSVARCGESAQAVSIGT